MVPEMILKFQIVLQFEWRRERNWGRTFST
jgi:hypothetical protein